MKEKIAYDQVGGIRKIDDGSNLFHFGYNKLVLGHFDFPWFVVAASPMYNCCSQLLFLYRLERERERERENIKEYYCILHKPLTLFLSETVS